MIKHFKTTEPIYSNSEYLRMGVRYRKGAGYEIVVEPVGLEFFGENPNSGFMISKSFDSEYYHYYMDMAVMVKECKRQSEKARQEAEAYMKATESYLLQQYINLAQAKGGKEIKLSGEVVETLT